MTNNKYKKADPIFIEESSSSGLVPLVGIVIFITIIIFLILSYKLN